MDNPYQRPAAAVVTAPTRERYNHRLDDVAYGQKRVVYALLLYFLAIALAGTMPVLGSLAMIVCIGLSCHGIYTLTRGLHYPLWARVICIGLIIVPLVGLLVLLALSNRATARLRRAGYSVGLLGARGY